MTLPEAGTSTVPVAQELKAPESWQTVEFISDLHLHADEPSTFWAWQQYMANTKADAVFILGDLFEVWIGDDVAAEAGFEADCVAVMREAAQRTSLYFMQGNRDFLVGAQLMRVCGATLLPDPTVLTFKGLRWLLSHGDALCLDDVNYQKFRQQVRTSQWQEAFLSQPLAKRKDIARHMRSQSEARHESGEPYADLDRAATCQWLTAARATTLIHGHTHQPAKHDLGGGLSRIVLTDWDLTTTPPRAEVLRLDASGPERLPLAVAR